MDIPTYPVQGSEHLPIALCLISVVLGSVVFVWRVGRRLVRRPHRAGLLGPAVVVVAALLGGVASARPWQWTVPVVGASGLRFGTDTLWSARIDGLPVALTSAEVGRRLGDQPIRVDAGGGRNTGVVHGTPINPVDADTPRREVRLYGYGPSISDPGPVPIPDRVLQQGFPAGAWDTKVIMVDPDRHRVHELATARRFFGTWWALASATWDTRDPNLDKPGHTTVSRLPLTAGLLHPDEVAAGAVAHVLWAAAPSMSATGVVWPARGTDGTNRSPDALPMGSWLRLRSDFPLNSLTPGARTIAIALQRYGVIIGDSAPVFALGGVTHPGWRSEDLRSIAGIRTSDLESVDATVLKVSTDSMLVQPVGGRPAP